MIPDRKVKIMFQNRSDEVDIPRNVSDLKWLKAERTGGRKAGKVELGKEFWEREWRRHLETMNISRYVTKRNQISFKTTYFLLSYNRCFIESRKRERLGERVASEERSSCGGYASSSWTVFCILLLLILARL